MKRLELLSHGKVRATHLQRQRRPSSIGVRTLLTSLTRSEIIQRHKLIINGLSVDLPAVRFLTTPSLARLIRNRTWRTGGQRLGSGPPAKSVRRLGELCVYVG